jgi:hypothetical protein
MPGKYFILPALFQLTLNVDYVRQSIAATGIYFYGKPKIFEIKSKDLLDRIC